MKTRYLCARNHNGDAQLAVVALMVEQSDVLWRMVAVMKAFLQVYSIEL